MKESHIKLLHAIELGYKVNIDGKIISPSGKIIKGSKTAQGYNHTSALFNGKKFKVMAHRLQAYFKYGSKIFNEGIHVRHLNGIPDDNSFENIAIGTASENNMDKPKDVRVRAAVLSQANRKKRFKYNYEQIKDFYTKHGWQKTEKEFSISNPSTLHHILKKTNKP